MSDNVIQFKKAHIRPIHNAKTPEAVTEAILARKMEYVSEIMGIEMRILYERLSTKHGINTSNPMIAKDLAFVSATLQSLVMRYFDIHHPLQIQADMIPLENVNDIVAAVNPKPAPKPPLQFA